MMSGRISKRFTFSAAHSINNPDWPGDKNTEHFGKCTSVHGHNYVLWLHISGPIDPKTGMIINLSEMKHIIEPIFQRLDHANVNDVLQNSLGTSELLAKWIHDKVKLLLPNHVSLQIELEETENNRVLYPTAIDPFQRHSLFGPI